MSNLLTFIMFVYVSSSEGVAHRLKLQVFGLRGQLYHINQLTCAHIIFNKAMTKFLKVNNIVCDMEVLKK